MCIKVEFIRDVIQSSVLTLESRDRIGKQPSRLNQIHLYDLFSVLLVNLKFYCSLGPPDTKPKDLSLPADTSGNNNNNNNNNSSNNNSSSNSNDMVSRRKILSRSRDDLNMETTFVQNEEDVWYQKEKLFRVSKILSVCVCAC